MEEKLRRLIRSQCLNCNDPDCKAAGHSEERDSFSLDMMGSASIEALPKTGGGRRDDSDKPISLIPGWNETVKRLGRTLCTCMSYSRVQKNQKKEQYTVL